MHVESPMILTEIKQIKKEVSKKLVMTILILNSIVKRVILLGII